MQNKKFTYLRIAFGLVWAVDAVLKWEPAFLNNIAQTLPTSGLPSLLLGWDHIFSSILNLDPHLFGILLALTESAIALALIFGVFTRAAIIVGIILSFVIWSTAEAFGLFWVAGSVSTGTSIGYILVFIALWFGLGFSSKESQ